jgi:hypothetical protein
MKKCLVVLVMVVALSGLAQARVYTLGVGGNDDQAFVLAGVRPDAASPTEFRLTFSYLDGIRENTEAGVTFTGGVTYDVIHAAEVPFEFPWGVGKGTLKLDGYLGGEAGLGVNTEGRSNYDAVANAIIGVGLGDAANRASVEGVVGPKDWTNFLNADNTKILRLVFVHRF